MTKFSIHQYLMFENWKLRFVWKLKIENWKLEFPAQRAGDLVPIEELTGELVCAASRSLLRGTGGAKASLNRAN